MHLTWKRVGSWEVLEDGCREISQKINTKQYRVQLSCMQTYHTTTIICTLGPGCTNSLNNNWVATLESRQQLRDNVPVCVRQRAKIICKFALLLSLQPQAFGEFRFHQPGCARSCRAFILLASREKHEEGKKCQKSDRNINKRINKLIMHNPPVV